MFGIGVGIGIEGKMNGIEMNGIGIGIELSGGIGIGIGIEQMELTPGLSPSNVKFAFINPFLAGYGSVPTSFAVIL